MKQADLRWIRALASELAGASRESRGGKVFFDQQWIDEVVIALRALANRDKS